MKNTIRKSESPTTRTPDAPIPGAVYHLMSSHMRHAVDTMAEFPPDHEIEMGNIYTALRLLISGILEAVKAPLSPEQCWDVADLVVDSILERAKVQQ